MLGTSELRLLLGEDAVSSAYLPYAKIHHLAWCIASMTGLRPSSSVLQAIQMLQLPTVNRACLV